MSNFREGLYEATQQDAKASQSVARKFSRLTYKLSTERSKMPDAYVRLNMHTSGPNRRLADVCRVGYSTAFGNIAQPGRANDC